MKPTEFASTFLTQSLLKPLPLTVIALLLVQNLPVLLKTELPVTFFHWQARVPLLHLLGTCSLVAFTIPTLILAFQLFRRETQLQQQLNELQAQLKSVSNERDRWQRLLGETMALAGQVRVPVTLDKCIRSQLWNERVRWVDYDELADGAQSLPSLPAVPIVQPTTTGVNLPAAVPVNSARPPAVLPQTEVVSAKQITQKTNNATSTSTNSNTTTTTATTTSNAAAATIINPKSSAGVIDSPQQVDGVVLSAVDYNTLPLVGSNGNNSPASKSSKGQPHQTAAATMEAGFTAGDAMILRGGLRVPRKPSS